MSINCETLTTTGGYHVQGYVNGKMVYSSKKLRTILHVGRVKAYWLRRIAKQIAGGRVV